MGGWEDRGRSCARAGSVSLRNRQDGPREAPLFLVGDEGFGNAQDGRCRINLAHSPNGEETLLPTRALCVPSQGPGVLPYLASLETSGSVAAGFPVPRQTSGRRKEVRRALAGSGLAAGASWGVHGVPARRPPLRQGQKTAVKRPRSLLRTTSCTESQADGFSKPTTGRSTSHVFAGGVRV